MVVLEVERAGEADFGNVEVVEEDVGDEGEAEEGECCQDQQEGGEVGAESGARDEGLDGADGEVEGGEDQAGGLLVVVVGGIFIFFFLISVCGLDAGRHW